MWGSVFRSVQSVFHTLSVLSEVGPPWQRRENGYIVSGSGGPSLYLEPHVEFDAEELAAPGPVDAVITPLGGQTLPGFELVHGPAASAELIATLQPKWVQPPQPTPFEAGDSVSDNFLYQKKCV